MRVVEAVFARMSSARERPHRRAIPAHALGPRSFQGYATALVTATLKRKQRRTIAAVRQRELRPDPGARGWSRLVESGRPCPPAGRGAASSKARGGVGGGDPGPNRGLRRAEGGSFARSQSSIVAVDVGRAEPVSASRPFAPGPAAGGTHFYIAAAKVANELAAAGRRSPCRGSRFEATWGRRWLPARRRSPAPGSVGSGQRRASFGLPGRGSWGCFVCSALRDELVHRTFELEPPRPLHRREGTTPPGARDPRSMLRGTRSSWGEPRFLRRLEERPPERARVRSALRLVLRQVRHEHARDPPERRTSAGSTGAAVADRESAARAGRPLDRLRTGPALRASGRRVVAIEYTSPSGPTCFLRPLRRDVARGAEDEPRCGVAIDWFPQSSRADPEVEDLHEVGVLAPVDEHDVLRFEIAVNDPLHVRFADRVADLERDVERAWERNGPPAAANALWSERPSRYSINIEAERAVGELAGEVDLDDVRVEETRSDLRLAVEALDELRVRAGAHGEESSPRRRDRSLSGTRGRRAPSRPRPRAGAPRCDLRARARRTGRGPRSHSRAGSFAPSPRAGAERRRSGKRARPRDMGPARRRAWGRTPRWPRGTS